MNNMPAKIPLAIIISVIVTGCAPVKTGPVRVPAVEYAKRLGYGPTMGPATVTAVAATSNNPRAENYQPYYGEPKARFASTENNESGFYEYRSSQQNERDYNGPLSLGDPGLTASLWKENSGGNDMFRDQRALQPMDLITIVVSEKDKGSKKANTEVKETSDIEASIQNLLGMEDSIANSNPNINMDALVVAALKNDFKGEGKTDREGNLTAKISAMVAEVLPSGILRIEGEKIISVNDEEQVMVISGLVRPRDISSANEVDSSKIANMRIDYFGKGVVGEAQDGGWFSRAMRRVWPF